MTTKIYLALAVIFTQLANIILIVFTKLIYEQKLFAELIFLISVCSLISSFSLTKLEIVLYQKSKNFDKALILISCIFPLFLIIFFFGIYSIIRHYAEYPALHIYLLIYTALLSLIEIQYFFNVQLGRYKQLMLSRMCVLIISLCVCLCIYLLNIKVTPQQILGYFTIISSIFIIVDLYTVYNNKQSINNYNFYFVEIKNSLNRLASTSVSSGINFLYIGVPIFIAQILKQVAFIADFGFISRFFTGAITIARMVFGQVFIAKLLDMQAKAEYKNVKKLFFKTVGSSIFLYCIIAIPNLFIFYFYGNYFNIENNVLVLFVFIVGLCQVLVNPLSNIRFISKEEFFYLGFDSIRLFLFASFMLLSIFTFEIRYVLASSILYIVYFIFLNRSLKKVITAN